MSLHHSLRARISMHESILRPAPNPLRSYHAKLANRRFGTNSPATSRCLANSCRTESDQLLGESLTELGQHWFAIGQTKALICRRNSGLCSTNFGRLSGPESTDIEQFRADFGDLWANSATFGRNFGQTGGFVGRLRASLVSTDRHRSFQLSTDFDRFEQSSTNSGQISNNFGPGRRNADCLGMLVEHGRMISWLKKAPWAAPGTQHWLCRTSSLFAIEQRFRTIADLLCGSLAGQCHDNLAR